MNGKVQAQWEYFKTEQHKRRRVREKDWLILNMEEIYEEKQQEISYTEDNIRTLDWKEHIRRRPGMYIGGWVTVRIPMMVFMFSERSDG